MDKIILLKEKDRVIELVYHSQYLHLYCYKDRENLLESFCKIVDFKLKGKYITRYIIKDIARYNEFVQNRSIMFDIFCKVVDSFTYVNFEANKQTYFEADYSSCILNWLELGVFGVFSDIVFGVTNNHYTVSEHTLVLDLPDNNKEVFHLNVIETRIQKQDNIYIVIKDSNIFKCEHGYKNLSYADFLGIFNSAYNNMLKDRNKIFNDLVLCNIDDIYKVAVGRFIISESFILNEALSYDLINIDTMKLQVNILFTKVLTMTRDILDRLKTTGGRCLDLNGKDVEIKKFIAKQVLLNRDFANDKWLLELNVDTNGIVQEYNLVKKLN